MYLGKARSLPERGAFESCFTRKEYTMLEMLARDKHSCLLRTFVNYGIKKFYNIGPRGQSHKTFKVINLLFILLARSFHSNEALFAQFIKWSSLQKSVSKFMPK
jgi:hypothetical protein